MSAEYCYWRIYPVTRLSHVPHFRLNKIDPCHPLAGGAFECFYPIRILKNGSNLLIFRAKESS